MAAGQAGRGRPALAFPSPRAPPFPSPGAPPFPSPRDSGERVRERGATMTRSCRKPQRVSLPRSSPRSAPFQHRRRGCPVDSATGQTTHGFQISKAAPLRPVHFGLLLSRQTASRGTRRRPALHPGGTAVRPAQDNLPSSPRHQGSPLPDRSRLPRTDCRPRCDHPRARRRPLSLTLSPLRAGRGDRKRPRQHRP